MASQLLLAIYNFSTAGGTSHTPGCFVPLNGDDAMGSGLPCKRMCLTLSPAAGCLRPRFTKLLAQGASSVMGTLSPQTFPVSLGAPRCAWPRPERSIVPFGRLMELETVLSKN